MIELLKKMTWVDVVELLVAGTIYGVFISVIGERDEELIRDLYSRPSLIPYHSVYIRELAEGTVLFHAFLFLNFYVLPRVVRKERLVLNICWVALTVVVITIVFGTLEHGLTAISIFACYALFKYGVVYVWSTSKKIHLRYRFLAPGVFLIAILWLVNTVFLIGAEADLDVIAAWGTIVPSGILLYSYCFLSIIPDALRKKRPWLSYIWKVFWVLAIAELPLWLLNLLITTGDEEASIMIVFFNSLLQFAVTMPFSWIIYKRYKRGTDEIVSLQTELGQSAAKLDFLRSQINPHFLFNALNTLYGTAIQEKAERTSEAIQKLGDMMRFMLHDNMQPKIQLAREVEYLNNYIGLQRLRTDAIPDVSISTQINGETSMEQISPMLLIPFVENAFKHGISFRASSYIRVSLEVVARTLHFDVSNSNHPAQDKDPEKDKSGVGLSNVRQRLELLYPQKHELSIRETGSEFFVHLTVQLS